MSDDDDEIKYNFYGEVENIVNIVLQNLNVEDCLSFTARLERTLTPRKKLFFIGDKLDFQSLASRSYLDLPFI